MKLNFTVFVCLTGLLFSSPALADPRLDVFVEKFQALGDKWVPGLHPDNPFGPYLDTRLEEGLDDTGRAELETAVRDGNCIRVGELMVEGFQHLYPFLDPAFEDPKSGPVVRFQILSRVQPLAETRCLMHRGYREIAARRNFSEFLVYDLAAEQQMPWASQMADDPDKDELMGILNILASMAFCNDYPPAQRDVWAMLNRSGGDAHGSGGRIVSGRACCASTVCLMMLTTGKWHGLDRCSPMRIALAKCRQRPGAFA